MIVITTIITMAVIHTIANNEEKRLALTDTKEVEESLQILVCMGELQA